MINRQTEKPNFCPTAGLISPTPGEQPPRTQTLLHIINVTDIKTVQVVWMKLDDIDKQILAILEQDDATPNRAIAERLDITPD